MTALSMQTSRTLECVLARLAEARESLDEILGSYSDPLLAFTAARRILSANEAGARFFGYGRQELVGRATDELVPERLRRPNGPPHRATKDLRSVEAPSLRKDGVEVPTVWTFGSVDGSTGPVFVALVRDRAQLIAELESLRRGDARYRSLLLASAAIVWVTDAAGEFVEPQPAWEAYTGQRWEDYRGARWISAVHPDDRARVMEDWTTAVRLQSSLFRTHGRIWSAQCDTWRAFQTRGVPIRSASGEIVEWIGALTDVHDTMEARDQEREAARRELEQAERRYRALVETNVLGVVVASEGGVLEANDAFLRMIRRSQEDLAARRIDWRAMTPPEHVPLYERALSEIRERGSCDPFEKEYVLHDGTRLPILIGAARLQREPLTWICYVLDISERKRAQAALLATNRRLLAADRAKDEFLATMSHELRTPLNAILGWATILKQEPRTPDRLERGLEVIQRNALAQERLVSDLLDVSRIITGKLRLSLRCMDLAAVVQAAADVVRPAAETKGVCFVVEVERGLGAMIADPDRVQQVLWNLLVNAIQFTPGGGRVSVTADRSPSGARIRVQDSGAGIADEHLPYIFDRFHQVDRSITRSHKGLGLGLAIVRHLVEAHGGTVEAHSDGVGRGATFTLMLPMRAVDTTYGSLEAMESPGSAEVEAITAPFAASLSNVRVLVVEDDPDSLELVRTILETAGAKVAACLDGREALDTPGPFDVIVSDIGMPQLDGYAFIQRIRARDAGIGVPAVALTAYARAEDADRVRRAGYQEHLAKPIDPSRLLDAVRRWASKKREDVSKLADGFGAS